MAKKKYISLTGIQYTFPVITTQEKVVWVSFTGNENDYVTSNKGVQEAIENSEKFKNKEIGISDKQVSDNDGGDDVTGDQFDPAVLADVTDINGAVNVLSGDPYKIPLKKLKTPDEISSAMESCNVSFPNLKL